MRTRLLAVLVAVAALSAACSDVVGGVGRAGGAASTPAPTAPQLPAPSPVSPPTGCPHVKYAAAKLSFDCITTGLQVSYNPNNAADIWPLEMNKLVEPSTQWVLNEGAGHWGSADGASLASIATRVRQRMIADNGYGLAPHLDTVASRATTVDGAKAYLLQTTITIDPAWAKRDGTSVKQEKLWIVAIQVRANDVSLWYTSVPDLVKSLWAKVPATIASIKVT